MLTIKKNKLKIAIGASVSMLALYSLYNTQHNIKTQKTALYHGSSFKFEAPKPMFNQRFNKESQPVIVWRGDGVFATNDRRIALTYTATIDTEGEYTHGVDIINKIDKNEPLTLFVFGGTSKEGALDKLYSDSAPGYIYHLDPKGFIHEEGLGKMEVVSRNVPNVKEIEIVNRKAEITKYVDHGLMKIVWNSKFQLGDF